MDGINGMIGDLAETPVGSVGRRAFAKVLKPKSGIIDTVDLTSKAQFEKRMHQLPVQIYQALKSGKLQIVDENYYSVKNMTGLAQRELMENADVKVVGKTNINARKLDTNKYFLLTGITLVSAVSVSDLDAAFGVAPAEILNGEFELVVGSTKLVSRVSNSVFNTSGMAETSEGYFKVTPQWILPQTDIIPQIFLPAAPTANTQVKVILHGAGIGKR